MNTHQIRMSNIVYRPSFAPRITATLLIAAGLCLLLAGCASTPAGIESYIDSTTAARATVIRAAADKLGAPYKRGANGPSAFSDDGLVQYAYAKANTQLPLAPHGLLGAGKPIDMAAAQPGDLVFYQTQAAGGDDSLRVGLYLNEHEMLFASAKQGKVVLQQNGSDYWTGRLLGVVKILP